MTYDPTEFMHEGEVIEDSRTGEEIPTGIQKVQSNTLATSLDITRVGTLELDEKAEFVLAEQLKPEEVSIRPDGLVYLPWTWYADRLNRAFGRLGWGLIPQAGAQKVPMGNMELVVWGHWLTIKGVPVGFEYGECAYRPDNHTMSFGDAAAGAKSNSLARNCKMLGMSLELWNQDWINDWKSKYAETYKANNGKNLWRKKTKPTNGGKPDKEVVVPENVKEVVVEGESEKLSVSDFRKVPVIKKLAKESGKKDSEVVKIINTLDSKTSYSFDEVLKLVKGE